MGAVLDQIGGGVRSLSMAFVWRDIGLGLWVGFWFIESNWNFATRASKGFFFTLFFTLLYYDEAYVWLFCLGVHIRSSLFDSYQSVFCLGHGKDTHAAGDISGSLYTTSFIPDRSFSFLHYFCPSLFFFPVNMRVTRR